MDKDKALKLALEAFTEIADETYDSGTNGAKAQRIAQAMILKVGEALAQPAPVQEPVKGAVLNKGGGITLCQNGHEESTFGFAGRLFTANPPAAKPAPVTDFGLTWERFKALESEIATIQSEWQISLKEIERLKAKPEPVWTLEECKKAIDTLNYIQGIAECGEHRAMRDDESLDHFVLGYVKKLEAAQPTQEPLTDERRKAIAVCFTSGKVSVSEVQRKLEITYANAQSLCQSIVDLGLANGLEIAPSLTRQTIEAAQGFN